LFFRKLSKYKSIDSGGRVYNNIGRCIPPGLLSPSGKLDFISHHKFNIAFENARWPGYTTEKIVAPMKCNSLPIYWGNPLVGREFNPKSFVNCHDYSSLDEVVEEVIRLDRDDDLYMAKLTEPWFNDNIATKYCNSDYVIPFFSRVFATQPHIHAKWAGVAPRNFGIIDSRVGLRGDNRIEIGPSERRVFE
jgi:hypothetical protein